jgi:hypothetical protein
VRGPANVPQLALGHSHLSNAGRLSHAIGRKIGQASDVSDDPSDEGGEGANAWLYDARWPSRSAHGRHHTADMLGEQSLSQVIKRLSPHSTCDVGHGPRPVVHFVANPPRQVADALSRLNHRRGGFLPGISLHSPSFQSGDTKIIGPAHTVKFELNREKGARPSVRGHYVSRPALGHSFGAQLKHCRSTTRLRDAFYCSLDHVE